MAQARADVRARRLLVLEVVRAMCAAGEKVSGGRVARRVLELHPEAAGMQLRSLQNDLGALVASGDVRLERQGSAVRYRVGRHVSAWVYGGGKGGRKPKGRRKTQDRACLCCGRTFRSQGPHNRLCERCRPGDGLPQTIYF